MCVPEAVPARLSVPLPLPLPGGELFTTAYGAVKGIARAKGHIVGTSVYSQSHKHALALLARGARLDRGGRNASVETDGQ